MSLIKKVLSGFATIALAANLAYSAPKVDVNKVANYVKSNGEAIWESHTSHFESYGGKVLEDKNSSGTVYHLKDKGNEICVLLDSMIVFMNWNKGSFGLYDENKDGTLDKRVISNKRFGSDEYCVEFAGLYPSLVSMKKRAGEMQIDASNRMGEPYTRSTPTMIADGSIKVLFEKQFPKDSWKKLQEDYDSEIKELSGSFSKEGYKAK